MVTMRAMQVYLVGGAVRDRLLGREVSERDWVVVGATPAELERGSSPSAAISRCSCIRKPRKNTRSRGWNARSPRATGASPPSSRRR